jgi:hypothetical protein
MQKYQKEERLPLVVFGANRRRREKGKTTQASYSNRNAIAVYIDSIEKKSLVFLIQNAHFHDKSASIDGHQGKKILCRLR